MRQLPMLIEYMCILLALDSLMYNECIAVDTGRPQGEDVELTL